MFKDKRACLKLWRCSCCILYFSSHDSISATLVVVLRFTFFNSYNEVVADVVDDVDDNGDDDGD